MVTDQFYVAFYETFSFDVSFRCNVINLKHPTNENSDKELRKNLGLIFITIREILLYETLHANLLP